MIRMRSQRVNNFFAKNFSRYQPLIALIVSDLPRARQNVRFRSFPNHRTLLYQRLKIGILRRKVARAIGEILVVAATGNLDGLVGLGTDATSDVHFGWQGQLSAVGRWAIVALGPGVAVLLGWHSVTDPAIRTLAVQFAAICFFNATFSAVVQRGDDRLSSIVSIGSSVFGWGKPKG